MIKDPEKARIVGAWIAALGDTLAAIAASDLYIQEKGAQKEEVKKQIEELQKN